MPNIESFFSNCNPPGHPPPPPPPPQSKLKWGYGTFQQHFIEEDVLNVVQKSIDYTVQPKRNARAI